GFYFWRNSNKNAQAATRAANFGGGRGIPVVVAKAVAQDLPITLDGLGSGTAFNTVTLQRRGDGELGDAQRNDTRYAQLVKDGVIPQQQYDTQHALAAQLEGAVALDTASIDSAKLN